MHEIDIFFQLNPFKRHVFKSYLELNNAALNEDFCIASMVWKKKSQATFSILIDE